MTVFPGESSLPKRFWVLSVLLLEQMLSKCLTFEEGIPADICLELYSPSFLVLKKRVVVVKVNLSLFVNNMISMIENSRDFTINN